MAFDGIADDHDGPGLPVLQFRPAELKPSYRIDAWQAACAPLFDVDIPAAPGPPADPFLTTWRVDNLVFGAGFSYPLRASRNRKHIGRQHEYVRMRFPRIDDTYIAIDDQVYNLTAGKIHIIDYSRPFIASVARSDIGSVYIPYAAIGYDPSRHPAYMCFDMDSPTGRVLSAAFYSMREQLAELSQAHAPGLANGFSELVRGLVFPGQIDERSLAAVRSGRRAAMNAFIERNLRNPDLGIASLARAFGASRATVYRDFARDGGVEHYIMKRRLERAYVDLADHPPARGAVRWVAETWGFESVSHFSRRFRERFQFPPSELVAVRAAEDRNGASATASSASLSTALLNPRRAHDWLELSSVLMPR